MSKQKKIRVGVSLGDLNGVGVEILLKTFSDKRMFDHLILFVYGNPKVLAFYKKTLSLQDVLYTSVKSTEQAQENTINVIHCWEEELKIEPGQASAELGKYAFLSLDSAVKDLASNKIDVLVTAPINKHTIQSKEFSFQGHTEYLAHYANEDHYLMLMVSDRLKVATVTSHIPLKDVASQITKDKIYDKLEVLHKTLIQDFGIHKPKIAVLGLNPHSGDKGLIGKEDQEVILPAVDQARSAGMLVMGPYGADGYFGSGVYAQFDAVLSMYHDQGLVPFKTMSFEEGVNFTAGLPIVRTSPDHGVAYEIAGKNIASENSFRQSVFLACDIYNTRKQYKQLIENQLKPNARLEKEAMS